MEAQTHISLLWKGNPTIGLRVMQRNEQIAAVYSGIDPETEESSIWTQSSLIEKGFI